MKKNTKIKNVKKNSPKYYNELVTEIGDILYNSLSKKALVGLVCSLIRERDYWKGQYNKLKERIEFDLTKKELQKQLIEGIKNLKQEIKKGLIK